MGVILRQTAGSYFPKCAGSYFPFTSYSPKPSIGPIGPIGPICVGTVKAHEPVPTTTKGTLVTNCT